MGLARSSRPGTSHWHHRKVLTLRRATRADAPFMARVAELAYSPYLTRMDGARPGPMDTDYRESVDRCEAWVAESGSQGVGFLLLVPEDTCLLLEGVAVLPEQQGRGYGRALLELAEERAQVTGLARIRLYTHETMVENQRLYERLGYVETHRGGEPGLVRVFYEKVLADGAPTAAG